MTMLVCLQLDKTDSYMRHSSNIASKVRKVRHTHNVCNLLPALACGTLAYTTAFMLGLMKQASLTRSEMTDSWSAS